MKTERVNEFLDQFSAWAQNRQDIVAVALVGSHARGAPGPGSDVDLVVITTRPEQYLADLSWTTGFGEVERQQIEDYTKLVSVRVWYSDRLEVEYGITDEDWTASPLDEGTRRVIADGMVVLFEQGELLSRHQALADASKQVDSQG
jgi:predicted nucleotidyltransferase